MFCECWEKREREQKEHSWSVESLLHAEGTYAPKSDSPPPRQSQNWESPYLFSSHEINNNILLWTQTLSVSLCLSVFLPAQISVFFSPPPASPAPLHRCLDSYLYLSCSLHLPVSSYSHSQRLAASFSPPWIVISTPPLLRLPLWLTRVAQRPHTYRNLCFSGIRKTEKNWICIKSQCKIYVRDLKKHLYFFLLFCANIAFKLTDFISIFISDASPDLNNQPCPNRFIRLYCFWTRRTIQSRDSNGACLPVCPVCHLNKNSRGFYSLLSDE